MRTGKVFLVMVAVLAMAGAAGAQTIWQIGNGPGPSTDPIAGASEFPASGLFSEEFPYDVGSDADPINYPTARGYIGTANVCTISSRPVCTDTARKQIINFDLECNYEDAKLVYARYGSEADIHKLDGVELTVAGSPPGENKWKLFEFELGELPSGPHTISIEYAGGGSNDGHYVDFIRLEGTPGASCYPTLCAAQDVPAGYLDVSDDGTTLTVKYLAFEGYAFNEIHVDVGCIVEDEYVGIPVNKQNQPKIGQFEYSIEYDEPVTMDSFDFNLCDIVAEGCSLDDLIIAAHAVVADVGYCEANAFAYGVNRPDKKLYGLDLAIPSAAELFPTSTGTTDGNQPNGLAFDVANGRLYYSSASKEDVPSTLWFWDGLTEANAGPLAGFVAGAAFYDGAYYYIENRTDDVRMVTLDPVTGNVVTDSLLWEGFTGDPDLNFRFGDIAIDADGILYGNGQKLNGTTALGVEFFTIDLADGTYIARGSFPNSGGTRQLAFGSDGDLYGHNAGGGMFYLIDPTNGAETPIGTAGLEFTDLASGELCMPPTETAWGGACEYDGTTPGDGFPFVDRGSWATYLEYTVYDPPTCVE